jgi:hypothetical protein
MIDPRIRKLFGKSCIKIDGFSFTGLYELTKLLEFHNKNNSPRIICTEFAFIYYFNNKKEFGIHEISIDDEYIKNFSKQMDIIVIEPEYLHEKNCVYGFVLL